MSDNDRTERLKTAPRSTTKRIDGLSKRDLTAELAIEKIDRALKELRSALHEAEDALGFARALIYEDRLKDTRWHTSKKTTDTADD